MTFTEFICLFPCIAALEGRLSISKSGKDKQPKLSQQEAVVNFMSIIAIFIKQISARHKCVSLQALCPSIAGLVINTVLA